MTRTLPRALAMLVLSIAVLSPRSLEAQSLRGSTSSVNRMYYHAVDHGIYFYKTGNGIRQAASEGRFVRLSNNADFRVANVSYPFVQEAAYLFVKRLASQYRSACGEQLVVTSAARPKSMRLANSVDKSVHPTGMAIDLRKPNNSRCREWLRSTLVYLEGQGVIEATEEFNPPHFHVAVFPTPYTRYVTRDGPSPALAANTVSEYRVRRGDSLWTIARRNSTSIDRIMSVNGLRSSSIKIGQTLIIPQ